MTRIGVVGTENSHVDHFVRLLNTEHRHGNARVVALSGGQCDRNAELAATGGIATVVDTASDLIGLVDAVIVSSRDGRTHRGDSVPLLEAGLPVLVDKPLAASAADAEAIVAAARRADAPLVSASALRFVPEMSRLASVADRVGQVAAVHVTGPADPASPYAGLYFYGIHHVEAVAQILAPSTPAPTPGTVRVERSGAAVLASTVLGGVHVVLTFVPPVDGAAPPFHVTVVGRRDVETHPLTLGPDYNAPVLDRFMAAIRHGEPPAADGALIAPVALLDAITAQLT